MSDNAKAWGDAFDFPMPGRAAKPRSSGLTMIIDKGLGLTETRDLLSLAGDYIDFLNPCPELGYETPTNSAVRREATTSSTLTGFQDQA